MTDIVTRLRDWASTICTVRGSLPEGSKSKLARDAADEIERLRKERDEARRDWCRLWARTDGRSLAPTQAARLREWDCFKGETP